MKWKILFQRFAAFDLDIFIQLGILKALLYALERSGPPIIPGLLRELHYVPAFIVINTLYVIASVHLFNATIGMHVWDLTMIMPDGGKPAISRVLVRYFLSYFSLLFFGMGYIYALFDEEGRTLHDAVSSVLVDDLDYGIISSMEKRHEGS